jgi:hypothetical protein
LFTNLQHVCTHSLCYNYTCKLTGWVGGQKKTGRERVRAKMIVRSDRPALPPSRIRRSESKRFAVPAESVRKIFSKVENNFLTLQVSIATAVMAPASVSFPPPATATSGKFALKTAVPCGNVTRCGTDSGRRGTAPSCPPSSRTGADAPPHASSAGDGGRRRGRKPGRPSHRGVGAGCGPATGPA